MWSLDQQVHFGLSISSPPGFAMAIPMHLLLQMMCLLVCDSFAQGSRFTYVHYLLFFILEFSCLLTHLVGIFKKFSNKWLF